MYRGGEREGKHQHVEKSVQKDVEAVAADEAAPHAIGRMQAAAVAPAASLSDWQQRALSEIGVVHPSRREPCGSELARL